MKKVLATLLAICLIFSAVGTALVVSAEGETETPEVTTQTPFYTASTKDWTFAETTVNDNTLFDKALFSNYALTKGKPTTIFTGKIWSIEDTSAWIDAGTGEMRFWVKAPYMAGTPDLGYKFDLAYKVAYDVVDGVITEDTPRAYPAAEATVTVKADGLWHEVRISAASFKKNTNFESYLKGSFASPITEIFYALRVTATTDVAAIEAKGGFYAGTSVEYYNEAITAEVNDGNVALEKVAAIDTADSNIGNSTNVSVTKNAFASGNKFHSTAACYSVTDAENYTFNQDNVLPYKIGTPTGDEFKVAVANGGDARTYVKNVSDHEMTFTVGIKTWCTDSINNKGVNFLLNKSVTVPNDGKWHEVRISFANIKTDEYKLNALKGIEGYSYGTVYLRIYDLNGDFTSTDDKLYITPMEIYNRSLVGPLDTDMNDANVVLEQLAKIDTASGGWSQSATVNKANVRIGDNKFYRRAYKFSVSDPENYSFGGNNYPYKNNSIVVGDLTDYFKYHGDMRTYVKNTSGHKMIIKVGVKLDYYDASAGKNKQAEGEYKTVEIPGDGKWHEVRIAYSDLFVNTTTTFYQVLTGATGSLNEIYFKVAGLENQFTSTTDELYVTPLEIYNTNINTAETTDFAREYNQSMLITKYRTSKTDANISKESVALDNESPFFTNAVTYTANDTYTAGYTSGQIGFVEKSGINSELFADWYYNDNADLRIWVKAVNGTKFKLGVYITGEIKTSNAIEVAASPDWQMVTIPRSAFGESQQMETVMAGNATVDVNIFFYAVDGTFTAAGDSISLAQCVEVYSDKAYEKGDANCDGVIGIKDLVRIKKQAANVEANVKNCDIDNSGSVEATDLTLMRNKLVKGAWN